MDLKDKYSATKKNLAQKLASQLNMVTLQKTFQLPEQEIQSTLKTLDFPGIIYGNVSNASTIYTMDRFNTLRGHGFAAENGNHLVDKLLFRNATIVPMINNVIQLVFYNFLFRNN